MMNRELKEAFGQIRAEETLKRTAKDYLDQKTHGYRRARVFRFRRLVPALTCLALLLAAGYRLYFTPTAAISIDINPSVELGVNRFNRVISFEAYNDDGQKLKDSLNVRFMDYPDAVNRIVESEYVASLLSDGELMTITVIGPDSAQASEILSKMRSCTEDRDNASCYYARSEEVEMAHEAGLSCGKYKAFLELQALDPNITAEDVQAMTMREIQELINRLCQDKAYESDDGTGCGQRDEEHGHHGEKHP